MIERYSRKEMAKIWDLQSKFGYFLEVELAVCEAYAERGEISKEALSDIKSKAKFDVARILELESTLKHDVIAFLTNVNENVGENSRFVHMGLTSSDVIDTALSLQLKAASTIIKEDLKAVIAAIKSLAQKHKNTICIGRSHGIHAEPETFAVKLCGWLAGFERAFLRFERASEDIMLGQISGPVGTYSNISPEIERITCEKLGLKPCKYSTQVIPRDFHAYYMQSLALIAAEIESCAVEIRHLQRTEVLELEEGFSKGQKGSSAMPHKKNPIASENLTGLSRLVRSNASAAMENIALWHERDISHSSVERVILPDSTILVDYMLDRFKGVVENLVVHEDNMLKNAQMYGGIVFSQKVLLALTAKGLSREEAYEIVQENALQAFGKADGDFKSNLKSDSRVASRLSEAEIDDCFSFDDYLQNVAEIYSRFGI